MKKGDIVKTKVIKGNSSEGISVVVDEIQEDAFDKKHQTIRGRRVYQNGRIGLQAVDVPLNQIIA